MSDSGESSAASSSLEEMMKLLIEDRRKREEEFASERANREREREAEREAREREVAKQMDTMRSQIDSLVELVKQSQKVGAETAAAMAAEKPASKEPQVKLVSLTEKDDIEAYLVTFERIMEAYKVEKDRRTYHLAPQLTGRAQQAFAALTSEDAKSYDAVKAAILVRYDINEEAYRRRFRTAIRKGSETNKELATRLMDLQAKWLREHQTVEEMREVIGLEQFLNALSREKKIWVTERKPKTCIQAGELADEYEQVRKQEPGEKTDLKQSRDPTKQCGFCKETGHTLEDCRLREKGKATATLGSESGRRAPIKCFNCWEEGHVKANCPKPRDKALLCTDPVTGAAQQPVREREPGVYRSGQVEGQTVNEILLDTGCSRTMVRSELVPAEKVLEEDSATVRCAHGDTVLYPLADLELEVDGHHIRVEAAISETLPVAVLLGRDVPELAQLLGGGPLEEVPESKDAMVVVTRAQARRQLEEEILRREKELESGVQPKPLSGEQGEEAPGEAQNTTDGARSKLTQDQRRTLRRQLGNQNKDKESGNPVLEMSAGELKDLQAKDPTLARIREAAEGKTSLAAGVGFFKRDGLLYRRWTPPGRGEEAQIEQLVLPQECRKTVLELGHQIPLAGHLGKQKTQQRILRRFYWPTVFKDVEEFCRCCLLYTSPSPRDATLSRMPSSA